MVDQSEDQDHTHSSTKEDSRRFLGHLTVENIDELLAPKDGQFWESYSCSLSNEGDAFSEEGPTDGKSVFWKNYRGTNLLKDEGGLFDEVNFVEWIPKSEPQVWQLQKADLVQVSGNTDSNYFCHMRRAFEDPASLIQMKVGQQLVWIHGYKVFELRSSEGLDRFTDSREVMLLTDGAAGNFYLRAATVAMLLAVTSLQIF